MVTASERSPSAGSEQRVTPLELFFDLVFVFAFTQVTAFLADDTTLAGLVRGLMILAVLWWAWVAYAWLTNTTDTRSAPVRLALFVAMAGMLVVAMTVPGAFDEHGILFACAYALVRAMHLILYALASRGDPDVRGAVRRLTPGVAVASSLLLAAGSSTGSPREPSSPPRSPSTTSPR